MISENLTLIVYVLSVLVLILIGWNINLTWRISRLTGNKHGGSIEDALKIIGSDLKNFSIFKDRIENYLKKIERRISRSLHGAHNVSFNAFKGMDSGGRQSFSLALLNEQGDGVILSTLHARDRVNVFAKEINKFSSTLELTEEEQQALTKAKESGKL